MYQNSLKDKCPKNILPEFHFDSLNGYHELIFRRNVIELDLNKHLRFFCCSVYLWTNIEYGKCCTPIKIFSHYVPYTKLIVFISV